MPKQPDTVEDLPSPPGGSTAGQKSNLLPVIIIIVAVPLITVGLWEFYMLPSIEKLATQNATLSEGGSPGAVPPGGERTGPMQTYEFNDIVANLSGSLKSRYIKVSFTLEGQAKDFPGLMEKNRAKIIDATLAVLSDLTLQDLEEPGVKNIVRNDLLNALGQTLGSNAITQLYFSEFVVQ